MPQTKPQCKCLWLRLMQALLLVYTTNMTSWQSRNALFEHFNQLGLAYHTLNHQAIFTVEDGADIKAAMPGGHTKNLFLKDRDGALFLLCTLGTTKIALNQLHKTLGCARLSFGDPDLMMTTLGLTPGSVTLFGLINNPQKTVTLILDAALLQADPVNFHPLSNDATTAMTQTDMRKFVRDWGGRVFECDFHGERPQARHLVLADLALNAHFEDNQVK